jgi:predicted Zn-dependent protease
MGANARTHARTHTCRVKWAWRNLAFYHLKNGKYVAAIPAFHNVLRLETKDEVCWKGLAQSYLATGTSRRRTPRPPPQRGQARSLTCDSPQASTWRR